MSHNHPKHLHRKRTNKVSTSTRMAVAQSNRHRERGEAKITLSEPPWMEKKDDLQSDTTKR